MKSGAVVKQLERRLVKIEYITEQATRALVLQEYPVGLVCTIPTTKGTIKLLMQHGTAEAWEQAARFHAT